MNQLIRNSLKFVQETTYNYSSQRLNNKIYYKLLSTSQCINTENNTTNNIVTEDEIKTILQTKFPLSKTITVEDVSGGCGAMFNICVESSEFKGLSIAKQHKSVYEVLKNQIKNIHGVHLHTKAVP